METTFQSKEECLLMVSVAHQCERFSDMIMYITQLPQFKTNEPFTTEERNLIMMSFRGSHLNNSSGLRTMYLIE